MSPRKYIKLSCHMCSVKQGFGRKIVVVGLYSICEYCFSEVIPEFQKEFDKELNYSL
mgnify:CR=1 FL=1